ncbi:MAG: nitrilase-related carbon-nitrogen hydrolase [Methanoregulaceae archaeon]
MTGITCCCAQVRSCWEDPEGTIRRVEPFIEQAAQKNAAIIAFPEQFPTGWNPASVSYSEDLNGPIVTTLTRLAEEYEIAILGSFRERSSRLPRNTAIAIDRQGKILATYAKIHPFSPAQENLHFSPGTEISTFTLKGVKFGIAICYDLRFPDLFRIYAECGVHGVLVPAAWPASRQHHWEIFIRSRALDNQMYIAGINTTGATPVDSYLGGSMAADPAGNVILHAGTDEGIYFFTLDPAEADTARQASRIPADRKDSLYRKFLS